ncbi:MAG: extracellular solute-binding protein [Chloroflexota bacterium]|nr:extracellular solute-binding protein [Chloroflexota bacterium]
MHGQAKKTRATLLLVLALLVGVAGPAAMAASAREAQETVELRFLSWTGAEAEPEFLAMLEEFTASHPNIEISSETVAGTGAATYPDVLRTGMAGGEPPDLFYMWGGSVAAPFIESGQVLPLDGYYQQYGWEPRLVPWAAEAMKVEGVPYGVPKATRGMGFWYRTDIFAQNEIAVPTTYAELEQACTTLREADVACLSLGGKFGWNTMRLLDYFIEMSAGPELHDRLNQLEASWESPEVVAAYELLRKWVDNEWIVPGFLSVSPDDARQPFYRGEAAMVFEGDWLESVLKSDEQEMANFDFFLPPTGHEPLRMSGFPEQVMISRDSRHPNEAAQFLDWFLRPEIQQKYFQAIGGSTGVLNAFPSESEWPRSVKWRQIIETTPAYPPTDQAFRKELMDSFFAVQDGIVAGQYSPAEGAAQMQQKAEEWKAEHGGV